MLSPWKKSYEKPDAAAAKSFQSCPTLCDPIDGSPPGQHIKKQRDYFANKGPSSQSYGFSSSQVWMWKLDYKKADTWQNQYNSVKFKNKIKLNKIFLKKLSAEELMLFNCGVGKDSWESLGLQGDPTSLS